MFGLSKRELNAKLVKAAIAGDVEKVEACLKKGANINCMVNGSTPLIEAAYNGRTDCVTFLLKNNPELDKRNDVNCTALMCAASKGYIDITKALLTAGADANLYGRGTKGEKELTAYDWAIGAKHEVLAKILEDAMKKTSSPPISVDAPKLPAAELKTAFDAEAIKEGGPEPEALPPDVMSKHTPPSL